MFGVSLPKNRFSTDTYPNLDTRFNGAPIPIPYGDLHNVIPVCIDTILKKYKYGARRLTAIDAIRNGDKTLVSGSDYTENLALAEFTLSSTPYLAANTLFYFVLEADYAIDGVNYMSFKKCGTASYAGGQGFSINAAGVWTPEPTIDLLFRVIGRTTLSAADDRMIDTSPYLRGAGFHLRDNPARTRIAQSFTTGATPFYLTALQFWTTNKGAVPAGSKFRATILSAYNPAEVRVGAQSQELEINTESKWRGYKVPFPLQSETSELIGDIRGVLKNNVGAMVSDGADMLEDLVETELGKSSSILDAVHLANFKAKRTYEVAYDVDRDMKFEEIVGKLESTLLFKFAPLHDGTHAPIVYEAGEPAGTPHLKDEHFLSFSMRRCFSDVKGFVKVKYDENTEEQDVFKVSEAESDVAQFVYGVEETLEVETYHKTSAGAAWLASELATMYGTPPLEIKFEVRGYGLNLLPGRDKVKITRTRAAYAGGTLAGVLFRIVRITKKPATASTEIIAILDTQTY